MGRAAIPDKYITNNRSRLATFNQRKRGLFKKAWQLSVLTGTEITLIVHNIKDPNTTFWGHYTPQTPATQYDLDSSTSYGQRPAISPTEKLKPSPATPEKRPMTLLADENVSLFDKINADKIHTENEKGYIAYTFDERNAQTTRISIASMRVH